MRMLETTELVLKINSQFKRFHAVKHANYQIPPGELALLLAIDRAADSAAGATVSDIARALRISPPAVSRHLRHLRHKGFVADCDDPADRRLVRLSVTQAGRTAMRADIERMDAFMARVLSRLVAGELEELSRLLDKLCDSMELEFQALGNEEEPCEKF